MHARAHHAEDTVGYTENVWDNSIVHNYNSVFVYIWTVVQIKNGIRNRKKRHGIVNS